VLCCSIGRDGGGTDLSITLQITCDLGETGSLFLWNELISLTTLLSLTNVPGGANLSFLFFPFPGPARIVEP